MDWLAAHADPILATGSAFFTALVIPIIVAQWKSKASTIPLASSIPTALTFAIFSSVYLALGLWATTTVELVQAGMWMVVAGQQLVYGGRRMLEWSIAIATICLLVGWVVAVMWVDDL